MGRQGITQHNVHAVANIILLSGQMPTIQKVRTILGTGSSSTIHKHLQTWKMERLLAEQDSAKIAGMQFLLNQNIQLRQKLQQVQDQIYAIEAHSEPKESIITKFWHQLTFKFRNQKADDNTLVC